MPATGAMAAASAIEMDGLKMNAMSSTLVGEHGAQIGRGLAQAAGTDEVGPPGAGHGLGAREEPPPAALHEQGPYRPVQLTFAIRTTRPRSDTAAALGSTADWPRSSMRFDTRGVTTKMDNAMSEEDSPAVKKSNPTA